MTNWYRIDDDLVEKVDEVDPAKKRNKPPLPDAAPPPPWDPLYIENPNQRGFANLPPGINKESPIELFKLFFTDDLVDKLCVYTNRNAELARAAAQETEKHQRRP
ncbi:hypothetical protein K469DRAFT_691650 [Zopfia rhizophila CBS 207.26]|uniref:PiggyBac transposable element-derived protein domain-containing protein n=1 Tax=Zopfia rhizophila CBS 207.26 TaxID=1314779 RepID=A0A6A6DV43_9PEZI|nr:hypothetical protein K469DRAFT_691650 [Zopfia rhizophila CBS 207.26]